MTSFTIIPIGSSGYRHIAVFLAILGGCRFCANSLKEHASAAFDKNLLTKIIPPSLKEHTSAAIGGNNATYERLTPLQRITKPNKRIVPSFT
jgi:hypothetical protein